MSDIIKKMSEHVPESFLWLRILLSASLAITPQYRSVTIKAIGFLPQRGVTHLLFFLKNKQETLNSISFSL